VKREHSNEYPILGVISSQSNLYINLHTPTTRQGPLHTNLANLLRTLRKKCLARQLHDRTLRMLDKMAHVENFIPMALQSTSAVCCPV
jgi:hypothetical protein